MAYTAEISRTNSTCILFVIDQSGSMASSFSGQSGRSKAEQLANAINRLLFELTMRCVKDQKEGPRNYYEVGVIGYGRNSPNPSVASAFTGKLAGQNLVWIRDLADNPARIEDRRQKIDDGNGGLTEVSVKSPVWFDPVAENGTPTLNALQLAYSILEPWILAHSNSFPPIVIHITDGEPNTDPSQAAQALRNLATNDGNVLLFNLHLSSRPGTSLFYPETDVGLPDQFAHDLFHMSSILPDNMQSAARHEGYKIGPQSRGFVFNADFEALIKFLDLGTRADLR